MSDLSILVQTLCVNPQGDWTLAWKKEHFGNTQSSLIWWKARYNAQLKLCLHTLSESNNSLLVKHTDIPLCDHTYIYNKLSYITSSLALIEYFIGFLFLAEMKIKYGVSSTVCFAFNFTLNVSIATEQHTIKSKSLYSFALVVGYWWNTAGAHIPGGWAI